MELRWASTRFSRSAEEIWSMAGSGGDTASSMDRTRILRWQLRPDPARAASDGYDAGHGRCRCFDDCCNPVPRPRPVKTFAWGIIGPGRIARRFASAVAGLEGSELRAVHGRDPDRARDFA